MSQFQSLGVNEALGKELFFKPLDLFKGAHLQAKLFPAFEEFIKVSLKASEGKASEEDLALMNNIYAIFQHEIFQDEEEFNAIILDLCKGTKLHFKDDEGNPIYLDSKITLQHHLKNPTTLLGLVLRLIMELFQNFG